MEPIKLILNIGIVATGADREYCHSSCAHLPEGNIIGKFCMLFKEELTPVRSSGMGGPDDLGFIYMRSDTCRFHSILIHKGANGDNLARAQNILNGNAGHQVICGMLGPTGPREENGDSKERTDRFLSDPLVCPYCKKRFADRMTSVMHRARCSSNS